MISKLDSILGALLDIQKDLGGFQSDIKTLFKRSDDDRLERQYDRAEREREHNQNQEAMAELRQNTSASIAELRDAASKRWGEVTSLMETLTVKVDYQSRKLEEHAATVASNASTIAALQIGRTKLVALASVGLFSLMAIGWAAQEAIKWAITVWFKKFGG